MKGITVKELTLHTYSREDHDIFQAAKEANLVFRWLTDSVDTPCYGIGQACRRAFWICELTISRVDDRTPGNETDALQEYRVIAC
jgi:hypothetical protein